MIIYMYDNMIFLFSSCPLLLCGCCNQGVYLRHVGVQ